MAEELQNIRFAAKINPADMNPDLIKRVKELADGNKDEFLLGTVIGRIRGVSYRSNPFSSEPSVAFTGAFEAIPADKSRPPIQAPMCFLPNSVHDFISTVIHDAEGLDLPVKAPERGKPENKRIDREVPIVVEIGVRHSKAPIGYEFVSSLITKKANAVDVLSDLRDMANGLEPKPGQKALAGPKKK